MTITAKDIAALREKTGAGMLDCKKALEESHGDMESAIDWLRKRGAAKAAKRADKVAAEGAVASYIHGNGRIGVLVEVNCETDFVAKNEQFQELVRDIAMHIAAISPQYVSRDEVPLEMIEREKAIYRDQLNAEGKPEEMVEKILEGKLNKFYEEICLLDQKFIKDEDKTIAKLLEEKTAEIGEKIHIRRFALYRLGEGIEKQESNLAKEVAEQLA
ncbi:MAG: elongation factor Ts [Candidatus Magasanikbacteria bacterium CG10_big_fil_rev_8_21_14_0_10_47_10]|uniref:Elongation factor Ts n=1 Tax=Candidatus Magasanikbacteria bacterium CG10_big_fil_rev_8_21_14_0_10_47_10 TaxID=1974652 RepID=A0A2H0TR90_9BACT|nr:MAG: elongation factor Ts [Candidatus Magasanikbacteria bacterium CG10_big_fil_rev_8_21_14_0_10_47_10]